MGNLNENRLDVVLTDQQIDNIITWIDQGEKEFPAASLNDDEREGMKAIDVDNKVFCEDAALEVDVTGKHIFPAFVNNTVLKTDLNLFTQADKIEARLMQFVQHMRDIKRITGHEAYNVASTIYRLYELANKAGIQDAKQPYEKLKVRFAAQGGSGRKETPPLP